MCAVTERADLEAALAAIAERDADVRAWVVRHPDDELRARGASLPAGPLSGFTLGVKDIIDTADLPTERGSPIYAGRRPTADAACVALARAAGALVVGKTVTTELAYLQPGPTRNPHHRGHTPGGSSSGSAAAVAAGMARVAFGTQTAGSVIRPGSFCGVVAFKATHGLVPLTGVHPLAPSLDTLGWFGRSVEDVIAVLEAVGPSASGPVAALGRARIGVYRGEDWPAAEPATVAAVAGAARALAAAGADVVELSPAAGLAGLGEVQRVTMVAEAGRALAWERLTAHDQLSPAMAALLDASGRMTAERYADAQRAAVAGRAAYDALLDEGGFDALLTASAPGEAPAGLSSTGDATFNRVWTLLGVPALTLPGALGPAGLPVGVQLVGRRWADRQLLALGCFAAPVVATLSAPRGA